MAVLRICARFFPYLGPPLGHFFFFLLLLRELGFCSVLSEAVS